MDDLDRMFRRLVQNIRNGYPAYLVQPFEVSELFQSLIPYRHNRQELEIDTNEDYEIVLCRLLSGERGLLGGDDVMRETIRQELASPNPNTAIYREFTSSRVALAADAVRRVDAAPAPASPARATRPVAPPPHGGIAPQPPVARPAAGALPSRPSAAPPRASGPSVRVSTPGGTGAPAGGATTSCRFCGGALPAGRRVVYCPHCGQNLAIQRCPACGSELEIDWKFCVTCGRGSSPQ